MPMMQVDTCLIGDCRDVMRRMIAEGVKVQMCVTSPPYWGLRDYGVEGQIGLEATPEEFIATMVEVFRMVRELLEEDGTLWLNLGDSYANDGKWGGETGGKQSYLDDNNRKRVGREKRRTGLKPKDLCGIPWRVAFALQADGWYLRQDIIWSKPSPIPESVTDRCTKSHEFLFLLSKSPKYYFDAHAIREEASYGNHHRTVFDNVPPVPPGQPPHVGLRHAPGPEAGRNKRSVWTIPSEAFPDAHFATFPKKLVEPCILAGTSERGHCPECEKRWVRETEVSYQDALGGSRRGANNNLKGRGEFGVRINDRALKVVETLGFRPTCDHGLEPVPDIVLDPFLGSGTVSEVAQRLGRGWIGIELNPSYTPMQCRRTAQTALVLGAS